MTLVQRLALRGTRVAARQRAVGLSECRRGYSSIIKENDFVLLQKKNDSSASPVLIGPLGPEKSSKIWPGLIQHDEIIGKAVRDTVTVATSRRKEASYRISIPTLGEYTNLTDRIVTPIYPQDANLIVNLLDLHPTVPNSNGANEEKLEIFEAGTGHGALTLHLAKAIHGANTAAPAIPNKKQGKDETPEQWESTKEAYEAWRKQRRAIIHTIDINPEHSRHAEKVVKNFRQGMYYPHVDFYTGQILEFVGDRWIERRSSAPFLDHAILDLPGTEKHIPTVELAMKPNGTLITFCPSITQILACVQSVKKEKVGLYLEKVIEVGAGVAVGGRVWDVRPVKPRALKQPVVIDDKLMKALAAKATKEPPWVLSEVFEEVGLASRLYVQDHPVGWDSAAAGPSIFPGESPATQESSPTQESSSTQESPATQESTAEQESTSTANSTPTGDSAPTEEPPKQPPVDQTDIPSENEDEDWEIICRPKVGLRVAGGGFIGVWKKIAAQKKPEEEGAPKHKTTFCRIWEVED